MKPKPPDHGSTAPAFELPTPYGVDVRLTSLLMQGPVVLEFLRGTWDPNTRKRLDELTGHYEELVAAGAQLVALICESPITVRGYLEQHPVPFSTLIDDDRAVTKAYGVWRRLSLPRGNIARPSTFVLDRCGYVLYSYVARLHVDAAPLDDVLDELRRAKDSQRERRD